MTPNVNDDKNDLILWYDDREKVKEWLLPIGRKAGIGRRKKEMLSVCNERRSLR